MSMTGTVNLDSPTYILGWHAPLSKLVKAFIQVIRDDTNDFHRLVDDVFA